MKNIRWQSVEKEPNWTKEEKSVLLAKSTRKKGIVQFAAADVVKVHSLPASEQSFLESFHCKFCCVCLGCSEEAISYAQHERTSFMGKRPAVLCALC